MTHCLIIGGHTGIGQWTSWVAAEHFDMVDGD